MLFGGKTENRHEMVESNSNVSVFPSNPDHDKLYLTFFDVKPPLWACYAMFCDLFRPDLIWCPCDMICLSRWSPPRPSPTRSDMVSWSRTPYQIWCTVLPSGTRFAALCTLYVHIFSAYSVFEIKFLFSAPSGRTGS